MTAETTDDTWETDTWETWKTFDIWEMWVGDQPVSEFLSYCDPTRPLRDEIGEYVDAVIAGDVFGPVEMGDEFDREYVINALLDRIRDEMAYAEEKR